MTEVHTPFLWKRAATAPAERAAELEAQERQDARLARRLLWQTLGGCVLCCGIGLFLIGWAVHTTDAGWGAIAFWTGLLIGDAGSLTLLVRYFAQSADLRV